MGPIRKTLGVAIGIAFITLIVVVASCSDPMQDSTSSNAVRRHPGIATTPRPAASDAKPDVASTLTKVHAKVGVNSGFSSDFSDTLRGHVTNKYNIRDDILKYIDENYKDQKLHAAFIDYAIAQQNFIEYGTNREAAIENADIVTKRITCIYRLLGPGRYDETKTILAMSLNTESRFKSYWKAVDLQSGRVTYAPRGNPCE